MDEIAARWRERLLAVLRREDPYVPLILSGGVDSGTLLAALLELGRQPRCYTLMLEGVRSADFAVAVKMAATYDLGLEVVEIPRTPEQLRWDVLRLLHQLRTPRRTVIQCAQPLLHLARQVATDGFDRAYVGTGAVVLDDRRVMVTLAEEGEEAARAYRAEKLNDRWAYCGTGAMHWIAWDSCGVSLAEPYSEEPLASYALSLDIAELARGPDGRKIQKGIAWRAFPDFWRESWWRRNVPLQVGTGIREWHDSLLKDPKLNPGRRYRDVRGVYGRLLREIESEQLTIA